jgi:hypothetical protein
MASGNATPPADVKRETWTKVGVWLSDQLSDMGADSAHIAAEELLPALCGLAKHLRDGKGWSK